MTVGQTPEVRNTGARYPVNMISAVSAKGALRFTVYESITSAGSYRFLQAAAAHSPANVYPIVNGHPAHRAAATREFAASTHGRLKLVFLPGCSPELNPDEWAWKNARHDRIGKTGVTRGHWCGSGWA